MKTIEEEEAERLRKKRLAEYEFQQQSKKIKQLMDEEIASRMKAKFQKGNLKNLFGGIQAPAEPESKPDILSKLVVKSKRPPTE